MANNDDDDNNNNGKHVSNLVFYAQSTIAVKAGKIIIIINELIHK